MRHGLATVTTAPQIPPATGWVLKAAKRFFAGGVCFDRGAEVPPEVLGKNYQAFLDNAHVRWVPPGQPSPVQPRKLEPTPATNYGNEPVVFRATGNPLEDWDLSVAATMELNNCPRAWAVDLLTGDSSAGGGAELYRQATRIDSEQQAIKNRTFGRRPVRAL